jgi:hypothetical protein
MKKGLILLILALFVLGCTQERLYTQYLVDDLKEKNESPEAEISEVKEVISVNNINETNVYVTDILKEGETKIITFNGQEYILKLEDTSLDYLFAYNLFSATVIINDEEFNLIDRDIIQLNNNSFFGILKIFVDETTMSPDFIEFYLGKNATYFNPPPFYNKFCSQDEDCVKIPSTCCNCSIYNHDYSLPKKYQNEYLSLLHNYCERINGFKMCIGAKEVYHWTCTAASKCINNKCELIKTEKYCKKNEDCVPSSCCHPSELVNKEYAPNCE